jgi:hypothetical protein
LRRMRIFWPFMFYLSSGMPGPVPGIHVSPIQKVAWTAGRTRP